MCSNYIYIYIYIYVCVFKCRSHALVSLWLSARILDWRLCQPAFDPSFGNLASLATLNCFDRTWMTIYIDVCVSIFLAVQELVIIIIQCCTNVTVWSVYLTTFLSKMSHRGMASYANLFTWKSTVTYLHMGGRSLTVILSCPPITGTDPGRDF